MKSGGISPHMQALLTPPTPFKREQLTAALYIFYSRKLARRVHTYRERGYDLAVHLECDPSVRRFNTIVVPQAISLKGRAHAVNVSPAAASLDTERILTIHTFSRGVAAPAGKDGPSDDLWSRWCEEQGYRHVLWAPDRLHANPLLLRNQKQLLRLVSRRACAPDLVAMDELLAELRGHRSLTFFALSRCLPTYDPEEVHAAIAALIIDAKVHSTIEFLPFQMSTELSAFHAFHQR